MEKLGGANEVRCARWRLLPALIAENKANADQIKELHEAFGTIGYVLTGLHATLALFHHYLLRDNTLKRMLPDGM